MFNKGDLVQYGNNGVCRVQDITAGMNGYDMTTQYYKLVPIGNANNVIFLPTNNDKAKIRAVLTKDVLNRILSELDTLNEYNIVNEKQCELIYKEAIFSLDCGKWLELLKTLCIRKQTRALQGKKVTSTDDRYFKNVSLRLSEEIAVVFGEAEAHKIIDDAILLFEGCVSI